MKSRLVQRFQSRGLRFLAAVGVVVLVSGSVACGSGGTDSTDIIIGMPVGLTGAGAAYSVPQRDGAQMVVDAINANGGIKELGGAKLKLVVKDTKSQPANASRLVRELASEGASVILGPVLSGEALAAKPVIQSLGLPNFVGSVDVTVTNDNVDGSVFRIVNNAGRMAGSAVEFVKHLVDTGQVSKLNKVGILSLSFPPGTSVTPVLQQGLGEMGVQSTVIEYDPSQIKDFAPTVAKLRSENVDMVMGYQYPNDAALFADAIAGQSWRPPAGFIFVGSPPFLDSFRKNEGDAVAGWISSSYGPNVEGDYFTPEAQQLSSEFEQKYGVTMPGTSANLGASMVSIVAAALVEAGSAEPESIAAAARKMSFDGPKDMPYPYYLSAGGVKFDENQENRKFVDPFVQVTYDGGVDTIFPESVADGPYRSMTAQ